MGFASRSPTARTTSRLLSALALFSTSVAAVFLLFPEPLADAFFAGWVLFSVVLSLVGGIGAWTNRTSLVWVTALLMTGLSILGMWSIGLFIAHAALFLLGSAFLSQWAGPREGVQEAIIANPPTVRESLSKALAGISSVGLGGWLVYRGAFTRELFQACASETVNCVIDNTHWDAVGVTVLGLLAVAFGSWLVWKQLYIARVLGLKQVG
ncbi:hypothetical protein [Haladaptatus sp. NG-SE-30]